MDKRAMYDLSYGLFVVTANVDGRDNGCITNTVQQVTTEPNQISVAINKANLTHDMVMESRKLTVSIIDQNASFSLFQHFGFQSGKSVDKFAGFADAKRVDNGTMVITKGCNAYISAWVTNTVDLGTHTLFIATVTNCEKLEDVPSATYAYYQSNIKPKPAKPAQAEAGKAVWRCSVCGYVYEGDPIPADFVCPLCKHPASDFEREVVGG